MPKTFLLFAALLTWTVATPAADIKTVAGTGKAGTKDGPALGAELNNPFGVVRGPDGALWFCEYDGDRKSVV